MSKNLKRHGRKVIALRCGNCCACCATIRAKPFLGAIDEAAPLRPLRSRPRRTHDPAPRGARVLPPEEDRTMTDEIEQLLKNLKLGRMRSIYDEQLRAAEKQQVSYSEFVAALLRAQWHRPPGERAGVAHPPRQSARALVAGNVSL